MNLTPDYVAWAGIGAMLSAVVSIVATIAAFRAAGAANEATKLATEQQRGALIREVYRDAHRVAVIATRVEQIAETMRVATSLMLNAAGQPGEAIASIETKHREVVERTKELSDYAQEVLGSEPSTKSDSELASIQRRVDGYLTELDAMRDRLSTELAFAQTGLSTPNALHLMAAQVRVMHKG